MATLPSRRDSRRTKNDFMRIAAKEAVKQGRTEEAFISQFKPAYQEMARREFKAAKEGL